MKIHIIGCSGTGKTYLAKGLAAKHHIPHYDLDDLQWDNSANTYGVKTPPDVRDAKLQNILSQESYVIEGVYFGWVQDSFQKADRIYLLDMPRHVYRCRIIKRFALRKLGFEKGKKESLRSLRELLAWTDTFQAKNLPQIRQILEQYPEKVVCLHSAKDVRKLI